MQAIISLFLCHSPMRWGCILMGLVATAATAYAQDYNPPYDGRVRVARLQFQANQLGGYSVSDSPAHSAWDHDYPMSVQGLMTAVTMLIRVEGPVDSVTTLAITDPDLMKHPYAGDSLPVVAGTDMGLGVFSMYLGRVAGFSLPLVLVHYVVGPLQMTPLEALQTATLNPARALRASDSLGTVAAGKVADLMLLDADPLADIWHTTQIRAVVADDRYYDRAALDDLLAATARAAARR